MNSNSVILYQHNMKLKQVINTKGWQKRNLSVGYGTRDKTVLKRTKKGKVYFLVKTFDKDLGELRSEVCASNIGRLFGFPVQQTWLCRIPQHKSLGLRHSFGVLIQLDVRRQRDTRRGQFREDLIHGADLISLIDKKFANTKDLKEKRKIYSLEVVVKAIRSYVAKNPGSEVLWDQFFELLAFDALIGGTDRHYYNWGLLEKADNGKFLRLAPAFDNGVSLMWKLEEYRPRFTQDLLIGDFINRAQSMFKKAGNSGKYTLFNVLEALYQTGDYSGSDIAKRVLDRLSSVRDSRIRSVVLNNVPQENDFGTQEENLEIVCWYATMRLQALKRTLQKLVTP